MKISNNTILITGGTSGIGRGLAEALHKRGNKVIIAGRRKNLLDEITSKNPGMEGVEIDVSDQKQIEKFAATIKSKYPNLNVLVNNAGITTLEDWNNNNVDVSAIHNLIATNISAVIGLTAALLPQLKKNKNAAVITTTSGLAFIPLAIAPTYSATKAFLHSWLQSLRYQLRDSGIEILELAPPYVATEFGGEKQANDPRAMPLNEYVSEVMQILESGEMPDGEILVERVKDFRIAERNGSYSNFFETLNKMFSEH